MVVQLEHRLPPQPARPPERGGHPRGVAGQLSMFHPTASARLHATQVEAGEERSAAFLAKVGVRDANKLYQETRHHIGVNPKLAPGVDPIPPGSEAWPFRPVGAGHELDLFGGQDRLRAASGLVPAAPRDDDTMSMLSMMSAASAKSAKSTKSAKSCASASGSPPLHPSAVSKPGSATSERASSSNSKARVERLEARIEEELNKRLEMEERLS